MPRYSRGEFHGKSVPAMVRIPAFAPREYPEREEQTMAIIKPVEQWQGLQKIRLAVETPAKQAVTIAVVALVVALAALAVATLAGRK